MNSEQEAINRAKKQGFPAYYDHDLYCAKCGEPWDSYGISHGDMTEEEKDNFLLGRGCPCCGYKENTEQEK